VLDASAMPPVPDEPELDPGSPIDSGAYDAPPHEVGTQDAATQDAAPLEDASVEPSIIAAVLGERCDYRELTGTVLVLKDTTSFDDELVARSLVFAGPLARAQAVSLSRGVCSYRESPRGSCEEDCAAKQLVCGDNGTCVSGQTQAREGARLTLSNGSGSQVLDASTGETQVITLEGALGVQLEFDRYVVTLGATPIPGPLTGLDTSFNNPGGVSDRVDIRWAEPVDGHVYAMAILERGSPFDPFTDCMADGSALSFTIEREVIEPFLTVGAFLKNTVDHLYVAAARTPLGCIEIRYAHRYYFSP
jgi:hypothetical protein